MDSKYYKWSKNRMKMIINSGFKEFDRQTNCISRGNAIGNTQYSNCIRPYTETECNGHTFPEGHLFNYDLQYFNISSAIRDMIKKMGKMVCLYEFFIYRKGEKHIIGWIITCGDSIIKLVNEEYRCDYNKRFKTLTLCQNIIEEKKD